jgi:hypothetical protein
MTTRTINARSISSASSAPRVEGNPRDQSTPSSVIGIHPDYLVDRRTTQSVANCSPRLNKGCRRAMHCLQGHSRKMTGGNRGARLRALCARTKCFPFVGARGSPHPPRRMPFGLFIGVRRVRRGPPIQVVAEGCALSGGSAPKFMRRENLCFLRKRRATPCRLAPENRLFWIRLRPHSSLASSKGRH